MKPTPALKRELGTPGAVLMGLGSIIGTGVFVSIGIAASVSGASVLLAIGIAAFVATCNALSSAQLAAAHPFSGGTYEYGYRYLTPRLGFIAGWMFLLAKSASAATAALGFAGYALGVVGIQNGQTPLALAAVLVLTLVVWAGVNRSNIANTLIVSVTLAALGVFVLAGIPELETAHLQPFFIDTPGFLQACALMFVAYTGYGRIATLGEEVKNPQQTIPRAIIITLLVSMGMYGAVALVAVGAIGTTGLNTPAPLEAAAQTFAFSPAAPLVALGAVTAMLGVLLNLILGLSRVLLAMGRRRDMPPITANVSVSVWVMGAVIAGLVLLGNIKTTWSFSAFNVLLYYAITNLAALQLPPVQRLYPRWLAWAGLAACIFLAFWVDPAVWLLGLVLIGVGLVWQATLGAIRLL